MSYSAFHEKQTETELVVKNVLADMNRTEATDIGLAFSNEDDIKKGNAEGTKEGLQSEDAAF